MTFYVLMMYIFKIVYHIFMQNTKTKNDKSNYNIKIIILEKVMSLFPLYIHTQTMQIQTMLYTNKSINHVTS